MQMLGVARAIFGAAAVVFCCSPAFAQPSAEPGHVDERFRPQPTAPSVGAPIDIPSAGEAAAPAGSESVTFTLSSISFDGSRVLSDGELQAMASGYTGHTVSLAQIYELADRVTAVYRERGYILARAIVPAQRVTDGHLTLHIVEGFIDQVKIQGDAGGAHDYLMAYGRRLSQTRPLTAQVLERELLLASDLTGFSVRSILTPSATVQGAADLTLVVDRRPVDAYLSVDNRGSKYLGPYEVMGGVFANDVFGTAGRLGLNAVVTPNSGPELAYGALSFDQPFGDDGLRSFTSLSYTRTKPGSILAVLDTKGRALNGDTSLSYPFVRSRDSNVVGSVGLSYHDVESENFAVKPLFSDHIRSVNANLYINTLDDWGGFSTASLRITQGLQIFGATRDSSPNKSRVGASGEYTRGNIDLTHDQPLFDSVSLFLAASGQTSFGDALLASEQFSLGGYSFDRAFDPSDVTGDSALAGKAELRWNAIDSLGFISGVQPYAFYEGGEVWQANALPGSPSHLSLTSTGAGVRFALGEHFTTDLQWAKPLDRDPVDHKRESRFFFTVTANL